MSAAKRAMAKNYRGPLTIESARMHELPAAGPSKPPASVPQPESPRAEAPKQRTLFDEE